MKNVKSYNEFINESRRLAYGPNPNVDNEFTEVLMELWNECEEKGEIKWDEDELQPISDAVFWKELQREVETILNKDDFRKWSEKNLDFWVKKVSKFMSPKSMALLVWDEFEDKSWEVEQYKEELKQSKIDLKQLHTDMELEAGQKGDKWTDADANRYGGEMNDVEKKIEDLENKLDWKYWKPKVEKAGSISSKMILKRLKDL